MEFYNPVINEELNTPVREETDVIVVGGGTAGVIAAIAAARSGAGTILVEQGNVPGGVLLGGGIKWMSFFNAYLAHGVEKKQCVAGIGQELVDIMKAEGHSPGHVEEAIDFGHESVGTQVDRELLINALLQILEREGVKLYLSTMFCDVVKDGRQVRGVIIQSKSGREALLAKAVIDCTGDGDVAARAGVPYTDMPERLGIGLMFGMGNVDLNRTIAYGEGKGINSHLGYGEKGSDSDKVCWLAIDLVKDPVFKDFMEQNSVWGPYIVSTHEGEATYINGVSTPALRDAVKNGRFARNPYINAVSADELTEAQLFLRERVFRFAAMLKDKLPGFENSYVNWTAPSMGVRSTRCVECEYDITDEHVINCLIPEDTIGIFGGNDSNYYGSTIKGGRWFGIPYRAIVPRHIDGLLVAGRMITRDFVAHMSTRLVGSCFIQGQAAGTAAAMSAASGVAVRDVDISALRRRLEADGVVLS